MCRRRRPCSRPNCRGLDCWRGCDLQAGWAVRVDVTVIGTGFSSEADARDAAWVHYDDRLELAKHNRRSRDIWPFCLSWSSAEVAWHTQASREVEDWGQRQGLR